MSEITKANCDILITIVDGVATLEKAPDGLRVIQRDYDTEGAIAADFDNYVDEEGKECFHSAWVTGPELTPDEERERAYIAAEGTKCLFCLSGDLQPGSVDIDGGSMYQIVTCSACDSIWTDGYTLDRVLDAAEGVPNVEA